MATANFYSLVSVSLDGNKLELGSAGTPVTLALASTSVKHDATYSVANTAKRVLLNVGATATDDIASYLCAIILSTTAGLVEITGTNAADNSTIPVLANVPLVLGKSVNDATGGGTVAYAAAGDFAGAAQNITKINFKNNSGAACVVRILALA